jgi:hypothetical protein
MDECWVNTDCFKSKQETDIRTVENRRRQDDIGWYMSIHTISFIPSFRCMYMKKEIDTKINKLDQKQRHISTFYKTS